MWRFLFLKFYKVLVKIQFRSWFCPIFRLLFYATGYYPQFCSQSWEVTKCNVHKHDASSWRDVLTWEQICEKFHRLFSLLSGVWAARSGVFLGIFVFRPASERFTPRLSEKTYWTSFRTFAKFCISWTLLTVWRPTYFCKFVSYCPIRFGKVETGPDSRLTIFPLNCSSELFIFTQSISQKVERTFEYLKVYKRLWPHGQGLQ